MAPGCLALISLNRMVRADYLIIGKKSRPVRDLWEYSDEETTSGR